MTVCPTLIVTVAGANCIPLIVTRTGLGTSSAAHVIEPATSRMIVSALRIVLYPLRHAAGRLVESSRVSRVLSSVPMILAEQIIRDPVHDVIAFRMDDPL